MLHAHRQREDHCDLHRWHNNNFCFHSSKRKKRFKTKKCVSVEIVSEKIVPRKALQINCFNSGEIKVLLLILILSTTTDNKPRSK